MMNFKQKELIQNFFKEMKEKFPETEFVSVTEGPENPASISLPLKMKTEKRN